MMVILIILAVIALLITLILITDINFIFSYKDSFSFKIRIWFVSLTSDRIASIAMSKKSGDEDEKPTPEPPKEKKKKSFSDILDIIMFVRSVISAALGEFFRYARLKLCRVKISLATDDPAETAIVYGMASSGLYTALEFLDSFMTVKKNYKNIGIVPDFTSDSCRIDMKIILKLKIIHLLLAFIHLLPELARGKKGI